MAGHTVGMTRLTVTRGDITTQDVDAIVNAANSTLLGGGGVDGAIHRRGGPEILEACRALRAGPLADGLPPGEAVATTAGALPSKRVIHTVGPVWHGGQSGEEDVLRSAFENSLERAREEGLRTIAFPAISTGAYGYPAEAAAQAAVTAVRDWVLANPGALEEVRFVQFSEHAHRTWSRMLEDVLDPG